MQEEKSQTGDFFERLTIALDRRSVQLNDLFQIVSKTAYYGWRDGATPNRRTLRDVAQFLEVRFEWLARGEEPMELPADKGQQGKVNEERAIYKTSKSSDEPSFDAVVRAMTPNEASAILARLLMEAELENKEAMTAARKLLEIRNEINRSEGLL